MYWRSVSWHLAHPCSAVLFPKRNSRRIVKMWVSKGLVSKSANILLVGQWQISITPLSKTWNTKLFRMCTCSDLSAVLAPLVTTFMAALLSSIGTGGCRGPNSSISKSFIYATVTTTSDKAMISASQLDFMTHFCVPDLTKLGPLPRVITRPIWDFPSI